MFSRAAGELHRLPGRPRRDVVRLFRERVAIAPTDRRAGRQGPVRREARTASG